MTLIKQEVKPYQILKVCQECKQGSLSFTGKQPKSLVVNGPKRFEHVCQHCKKIAWLNRAFPLTELVPIGKPEIIEEQPKHKKKWKEKQKGLNLKSKE